MTSNGFNAVPISLRSTAQWAVWKLVPQTARPKPLKVPFTVTGQPADSMNPAQWGSYEAAYETWNKNQSTYNGLGFLFVPQGEFAGLDIDNCVEDGKLSDMALSIIHEFNTYTEYSPSGTGVKLFTRTTWHPSVNQRQGIKQGGLELYFSKRYFTVTGHQVPGTNDEVTDCSDKLEALYHRLLLLSKDGLNSAAPLVSIASEELPQDFLEEIAARNSNVAARILTEAQAMRSGADPVEQLYRSQDTRVDRSRNDMYLATWLLGHGYSPGIVLSVLTHPTWFSGSKHRERPTSNYAVATISRAVHSLRERRRTLPDASKHLTELGNAERLIEAYGNNLRFCSERKCWMLWTGSCWVPDHTGVTDRYLHEMVRGLHASVTSVTDADKATKMLKWAFASETNKTRKATLELAQTMEGIRLPPGTFDVSLWQFPVANGVIDLKTGDLIPHSREHYFSGTSAIGYDPSATCPKWLEALQTWLPDDNLRLFVQRAVGYTLTGSNSEQVFFFLHGPGSNGKSTFMLVLQGLLGRFARRITTEAITQHKMGNPGTVRDQAAARLTGARMGIVSEADQNMRLAEGWLKDMTGGGPVATKVLYSDQGETIPTVKIWFDANYRLRASPGTTDGGDAQYDAFWRRMREISFNVRVPSDRRVKDFHRLLLTEEGPGILAWAVEGCLDWQENGLPVPEAVRRATTEYRQEMDTLRPFIESTLLCEEGAYVSQKELYLAYKFWAAADGEVSVQKRVLREWLKERGFVLVMHNGQECWKGYRLKQSLNHL